MHRVSSDQEATTYNKRGNWGDMQYLPILNSEEFCGVVFRGITQNILPEERRFAGCQTTRLINLRLF